MLHQDGLRKAIRYFGTQQALGKAINASQQQVNYWLNSSKDIPYDYVLKIESATGGAVTRHELVPCKQKINKIIDQLIEHELQAFLIKLFEDMANEFFLGTVLSQTKTNTAVLSKLMSLEALAQSFSRVSNKLLKKNSKKNSNHLLCKIYGN